MTCYGHGRVSTCELVKNINPITGNARRTAQTNMTAPESQIDADARGNSRAQPFNAVLYLKFEWSFGRGTAVACFEGVRNGVSYVWSSLLTLYLLPWRILTLGVRIVDGVLYPFPIVHHIAFRKCMYAQHLQPCISPGSVWRPFIIFILLGPARCRCRLGTTHHIRHVRGI
jgi:hypothetical protein